jgi:hypothetical protein
MKERFFYRKKDLVTLLNVLKPYPLVQINAALHQLIEDKTEYITDKYGRLGHLINIDDLYLFQPLELNQNKSSIYDRSVPLDVKHDKILIKLPKEIKVNEAIIKIKEKDEQEVKGRESTSDLYTKIAENYNLAITEQLIVKGEKNWYMFCHLGIDFLVKNGFDRKTIQQLLAEHIMDELYLTDILTILKDFEQNPIYETQEVFKYIKLYVKKQILTGKHNLKGFLWKEKGNKVLLVKESGVADEWHLAEAVDEKNLEEKLIEQKTTILKNLNTLIGFMISFKTEEYVVFKTKNINNLRDDGARCDQSSKSKAIDILNVITDNNYKYPPEKKISQRVICVIQELYLRLFDRERKDTKRWFLSPPETFLTNIDKYTTAEKKGKKKK